MIILDGAKRAKQWEAELLSAKPKHVAGLAGVLIGNDPASVLYLELKAKMAKRLGIGFSLHRLPATASMAKVRELIDGLNADKAVGGIIIQLPLPNKFDVDEVVNLVAVEKDVDGLTDAMIAKQDVLPATAAGIVELAHAYKLKFAEKEVVLIGFSRLLNVPLAVYLANQGARVSVLQEGTKDFSLLKNADVVVTAVGKKDLVRGSHVKEGVVVIDAGIVRVGKRVFGDVNFASVAKKASMITPVPGGVGPMTLVGLLSNLIKLQKAAVSE